MDEVLLRLLQRGPDIFFALERWFLVVSVQLLVELLGVARNLLCALRFHSARDLLRCRPRVLFQALQEDCVFLFCPALAVRGLRRRTGD